MCDVPILYHTFLVDMPSYKCRRRPRSAPPIMRSPVRPKKRKQWSEDSMKAAIKAVQDGLTSINRAADEHGVPRTTLKDRLSGRVVHGTNPGPRPYLNKEEESELSTFLVEASKVGYGKTKKQIEQMVESVAKEKGLLRSVRISDGWWRRFMERNPTLSLRKGDATAHVRMDSVNREAIDGYFSLLKEIFDEFGLRTSPGQVYNMDETGMPLDPKPPKVVTRRGQKKVRYRTSGKKGQITVLGCINAIGNTIPPMVIFDAHNLNRSWTTGEVPGTIYGLSEKGWIDRELFQGWMTDHFIKYAVSARPILLLLDGHSSHYEPETVRYARDHDIIMFCLPPHTSHETQPLDVGVFGPLKVQWTAVCHEYVQQNPGKLITKYQFSPLFSEAWGKALTHGNILSGFRRSGVFPLNPAAIHVPEDPTLNQPLILSNATTAPTQLVTEVDTSPILPSSSEHKLMDEQHAIYERRFEEGYDVPDAEYVAWLEIYHPESVPSDRYQLSTDESTSVVEHFTSLSSFMAPPPLGPLATPAHSVFLTAPPTSGPKTTPTHSVFLTAPHPPGPKATPAHSSVTVLPPPGPRATPAHSSLTVLPPPGPLATPTHSGSLTALPSPGPLATLTQSGFLMTPPPPGPLATPTQSGSIMAPPPPGPRATPTHSGSLTAPPPPGPLATPTHSSSLTAMPPPGPLATPTHSSSLTSPPPPGPLATPTQSGFLTAPPTSGPLATPTHSSSLTAPRLLGPLATPTHSGSLMAPSPPGPLATSTHSDSVMVPPPGSLTTPAPAGSQLRTSKSSSPPSFTKFLIMPSTTKAPTTSAKRFSGARVLTSADHLAMLEEKEQKKRKDAEEKEMRRKEREDKRRQKQEEVKRKAEERAKKAEEKKAKRASARSKPATKRKSVGVAKKPPKKSKDTDSSNVYHEPRRQSGRVLCPTQKEVNDSNTCCMCFGTYDEDVAEDTGREWLECACHKWVHEDCVERIVVDPGGDERLCPFCLDIFDP